MAPARRKSTPGASAGSKKSGQLGKVSSSIVSNGSSQPDADKPEHDDVVDELASNQESNAAEETPSTSNTAKSKGKRTKKQLWEYKLVKPIEEFKPVIIDEDPAPDAEFNNRGRVKRSCMQRATQNIAALNIVNPFRQIKSKLNPTNKKQTTNAPEPQTPSSSCRVSNYSPSTANLNEPNNKMMEVISPSMAKDTVTAITAILPEDLCLNLDSTLCQKLSLSANEVEDETAAVVVEPHAEINPQEYFESAVAADKGQESVEEQQRLPLEAATNECKNDLKNNFFRCSRLSSYVPSNTVTSTQKRPLAAVNKKGRRSSAVAAQLPPPSSSQQDEQMDSGKVAAATSRSNKNKPMEMDVEEKPVNNSTTRALFPFFPNGFDPEEGEEDCEEDIAELTHASSHLGIRDQDDEAGSTIAQINTSTSTVDSEKEQLPVRKETKKEAATKPTAAKKNTTTKKKPVARKKSGAKSPAPKNPQVSSSRRQVLKLRKKALATTAAAKPKKAAAKPKKEVAKNVGKKAAGRKGQLQQSPETKNPMKQRLKKLQKKWRQVLYQ
uniref:Uncharacterized protein n=1 Tax=Ditylenchus dipsaci TaxID=166011 RepID=A0A915DEP0_9BILA